MNQREAFEYIEFLQTSGIVPGLGRIRELLRRLGNPQEHLRFIHIAGTNGKGSTLAYISTVLKAAGYKVGRYISPTIFQYRERIQVSGRPITVKALCGLTERIREAAEAMAEEGLGRPSVFEAETAIGFLYFLEQNCDIVVLETGMGGLEDATNIIPAPAVCVLASVSMDHMRFLGDTLAKIAAQKAGIIKPGSVVVSVKQQPEAMEVIRAKCEECGVPLWIADVETAAGVRYGIEKQKFSYGGFRNLEISLAGTYQITNACLAVEALKACAAAGFDVPEKALRKGLLETAWPGRFELLAKRPYFFADGAHNEDAARALSDSIQFYFTNKRIIYIMGILKDKEYEKVIRLTAGFADQIFTVTTPDNPRALPAIELARAVSEVNPHVTATDSLEEAVEMAYLFAGQGDVILAFGSLSFLGRLTEIVKARNSSSSNGAKRKK